MPELVSIPTPTTPLDGLFYDAGPRAIGAAQLFHGNTMNFYVGPPRFLPSTLVPRGWSCLAYNRRGHDVLSNRDSRDLEGGAYQTFSEATEDDGLARAWLVARTGQAPVAIGHSNGGLLAAVHAAAGADVPALVLLSAHRGGRDVVRRMADQGLLVGDQYEILTQRARDLVADGHPETLLITPGWWRVISAGTLVEFLDTCPDLLEAAERIHCPVLYIVGDAEPEELYPVAAFAERCPGAVETVRLADCGHYYRGHEEQVGAIIANWLESAK